MDKYETALALMNMVILAGNDAKAVHLAWDNLYEFIYENFDRPETYMGAGKRDWAEIRTRPGFAAEVNEAAEFFPHDRDEILRRLREKPPEYSDVVFPIAIARYLLRDCRAPVYAFEVKTFDEFHYRYGVAIIEGSGIAWKSKHTAK